MALLTEAELRLRLRAEDLNAMREYHVEKGTIVTPSARAFLSDHKIELLIGNADSGCNPAVLVENGSTAPSECRKQPPAGAGNGNLPAFQAPKRYESETGGYFDEKPEHMTSLRGSRLVAKDHPVIKLRGKLDSLEAEMASVQIALEKLGKTQLAADLDAVLAFVHEILRCEVLDQQLADAPILGMSESEIRARSHTPKKYYGIAHFGASRKDGEAIVRLNRLRTCAREVELVAFDAFKEAYGPPRREDLLRGLNRLSSLFYVLMLREKAAQIGSKEEV